MQMPETTLVTIGEMLVEFVSHKTGCALTQLAEYSGPYPSGAPAIFADQAALCGAHSMIFGSIGDDGFGDALIKRLIDDGVYTTAVKIRPNRTTGVAFVSYNQDGSRKFIFHLTNTAADDIEFDPKHLPNGNLILHVSGSSLGNSNLRKVILTAVDAVTARGGKVSCDPNARTELMQNEAAFESLRQIISNSHIFLPSTGDIEFLYPNQTEDEVIGKLLETQIEIIALKRGKRGVSVFTEVDHFSLPPLNVVEVDPTGAGDCFCSTLLACIANDMPLRESAELANVAGALSVTRRGPMEGNRDLNSIRTEFISANSGNIKQREVS